MSNVFIQTSPKNTMKKRVNIKRKKSSKEIQRISTKIPGFDKLIQGGFKNKSINLLVGGSGSGKSIFSTHFIMNSMKDGEPCLYITFEEKKDQFYENMMNFGWDLEEYEKRGLFTFLEYAPEKVKLMLEEGGGTIESIIIKKKITRLIIDSITSFVLLFNNEATKRDATLELFNIISKWNCTTLMTLEGKRLDDQKEMASALEFEADSIITIYFPREEKGRERYIEILKMRGTEHSTSLHKLEITKSGMKVGDKPVKAPKDF